MKSEHRLRRRARRLLRMAAMIVVPATLLAGLAGSGSASTSVQAATAPSASSPPTISGTPEQGRTLTASSGSWAGSAPIVFSYKWQRCDPDGSGCAAIASATPQTYLLTTADVGHTIRVRATATNSAG